MKTSELWILAGAIVLLVIISQNTAADTAAATDNSFQPQTDTSQLTHNQWMALEFGGDPED